jgi:glycosyltransferase involved in cell wall biosynthesis
MTTKTQEKVSIIMPTYNREGFIMETIESIRRQTYPNWELIIVDDGSDDNTKKIVLAIDDERIEFHEAGRVGIGGKIKNIGLAKSTGEFIAFIDSDDLWAPEKLEKQLDALRHPDSDFCLTGGYNFKKKDEPLEFFYRQREGIKTGDHFLSYFKSELPCFTQALMLRRSCLETSGYFKEEKSFSDADFIINLAFHNKGIILYEPLVFRRLHNESYSNPNWIKSYEEGIRIIDGYRDQLPGEIYRNALFRLHLNFGESFLQRKKNKQAAGEFFIAWKYKPFSIIPLKKILKSTFAF